ncbi:MAG: hypothetical protein K6A42_07455 [Treponema sp.]|nr:hypothetical protein [Treponema sp.]
MENLFCKIKKNLAVALVLFMAGAGLLAAQASGTDGLKVNSVSAKEAELYVLGGANKWDKAIQLAFFNGKNSIPYLDLEVAFYFFDKALEFIEVDPEHSHTYSVSGQTATFTRENGAYARFNAADGSVVFSDYDMICRFSSAKNGGDLLTNYPYQKNEKGELLRNSNGAPMVALLERLPNGANVSKERNQLVIELYKKYGIPMYVYEGAFFLPISTISDLFYSEYGLCLAYNGKDLFLLNASEAFENKTKNSKGKTIKQLYYKGDKKNYDADLALFNYQELVMMLEVKYGLTDLRLENARYDEFFEKEGLKSRFLLGKPKAAEEVLKEFIVVYLDDMHCVMKSPSPYVGKSFDTRVKMDTEVPKTEYWKPFLEGMEQDSDVRSRTNLVDRSDHPIPYMEIGNTAYVTFDSFEDFFDDHQIYYSDTFTKNLEALLAESDPVAIAYYANSQINREKSPIKNVVIDLSLNTGGSLDSAMYLVSWIQGDARLNIANSKIGSEYSNSYRADVDLDGAITSKDFLASKPLNIYCLTSYGTFSCGNLMASCLKESKAAKLIGRKSSGGACAVQACITPDGTAFTFSGNYKFSAVRNGKYYTIDAGVQPDYPIEDSEKLYDRAWLTDYINKLK